MTNPLHYLQAIIKFLALLTLPKNLKKADFVRS